MTENPRPTMRDWLSGMRETFGTTEPATIYCRTQWAPLDWTPHGTAKATVIQDTTDVR